jgi:hypothetical protein
MKKITSLSMLIIFILLFVFLKYYAGLQSYNYHVAYFLEYLFYWSAALFLLSLFAFVLSNIKYKIWFSITILFMVISILFASSISDNDMFFSGQYVILWIISLYSLVSVIYFIVQFFKNKYKNNNQEKSEKNYFI